MCGSTSPGVIQRPPASITRVASVSGVSGSSARGPTQAITPSRAASTPSSMAPYAAPPGVIVASRALAQSVSYFGLMLYSVSALLARRVRTASSAISPAITSSTAVSSQGKRSGSGRASS